MDAGVSPEGLRLDGRRACELRRLRCSLGVLPDADGSALLCAGGTRALAAAYGPREAGGGAARDGAAAGCTLTVELTHACVASGEPRRGPRRDRRAAEEGAALRECLLGAVLASLLPRTTLHVAVSLLSVDGGSFAAAFNAALLALAHAGVPLRDTAGAGGAALLRGVACADPCRQEEARGTEATAVVLPGSGRLLWLSQREQRCSEADSERLAAAAVDAATAAAAWMRAQLAEHTRRAVAECGWRAL